MFPVYGVVEFILHDLTVQGRAPDILVPILPQVGKQLPDGVPEYILCRKAQEFLVLVVDIEEDCIVKAAVLRICHMKDGIGNGKIVEHIKDLQRMVYAALRRDVLIIVSVQTHLGVLLQVFYVEIFRKKRITHGKVESDRLAVDLPDRSADLLHLFPKSMGLFSVPYLLEHCEVASGVAADGASEPDLLIKLMAEGRQNPVSEFIAVLRMDRIKIIDPYVHADKVRAPQIKLFLESFCFLCDPA